MPSSWCLRRRLASVHLRAASRSSSAWPQRICVSQVKGCVGVLVESDQHVLGVALQVPLENVHQRLQGVRRGTAWRVPGPRSSEWSNPSEAATFACGHNSSATARSATS